MRVNDKFVVFEGNSPSLYCYVDSELEDDSIECRVINGGWTFRLNPRTGLAQWSSPSGKHEDRFNYVPMRYLPTPPPGDYNDVLEFIRESGYRPGRQSKAKLWLLDQNAKLSLFLRRLKKACEAFAASWRTRKPGRVSHRDERSSDDLWNDDIPF